MYFVTLKNKQKLPSISVIFYIHFFFRSSFPDLDIIYFLICYYFRFCSFIHPSNLMPLYIFNDPEDVYISLNFIKL